MFIRTKYGSYINLDTVTYLGIKMPNDGNFIVFANHLSGGDQIDTTHITGGFSSREEAQKELDFLISSWGFSNKPLGTIINTVAI
jgi:hypothetical protein